MGQPRVFHWSDAGAPQLSGSAGTVAAILDACLVNGFGSKNITSINRSGATATVVCTAHGFSVWGRLIRMAGWNQSEYNGDFWITYVDANTFTVTVTGTPATPGTSAGTPTAKIAPCDWTIAQTGTNLRSYKQGAGSNGFYLGLDDTGTTSARVRGFETMSAAGVAVASGTGPFPTDAQLSGGSFFPKSTVADASARFWIIFADEKTIYLYTHRAGTTAGTHDHGFVFGDFETYVPGDVYNTILIADTSATPGFTPTLQTTVTFNTAFHAANPYGNLWAARSRSGSGGSVRVNRIHMGAALFAGVGASPGLVMGAQGIAYPIPAVGGLAMANIGVVESSTDGVRGVFRGMWIPCHAQPLADGDIFAGAAGTSLAGKGFTLFRTISGSGSGSWIFQRIGAWNG